ncbi:PT domain-containing protein [Halobaculum sp. CBA1158]|uniref:PT domain-containing protein n=1 Tax=Halobaculum sp. CBA1158 TaxID=2904243 RepID=UPI001F417DAC|nr:PT domain-containing protein [Halobaculum sp. CBA1158]UIP01052.1 PT domain-containing protein [Halobaculum sp. CBA1158]
MVPDPGAGDDPPAEEQADDGASEGVAGDAVADETRARARLDENRRRLLGIAGAGVLGAAGVAGAWRASRAGGSPPTGTPSATPAPTATETATDDPTETPTDEPPGQVPALVRRYAPDLYYGRLEKWFPTDPRPYVVETADGRVVDGFTALDDYSAAFAETGEPPAPTVFYAVVEAADGIDAVQYWQYSVFDQFTVNFHWHDWELLQVFVDRESGRPLLLSASAHSRSVPNNEFLDPDLSGDARPGVLAEVGSHSSASEVNGRVPTFERLAGGDWNSDVSNDFVDVASGDPTRFAYGLPRDEGARLPFVMPELDGHRLDDHPDLSVGPEGFVDAAVTVSDWRGIPRPPESLPLRVPGLVFTHPESATDGDATYALEPIEVLSDVIDDFVGPQLSFEFAVPGFLEDRLASHITSVGIPWEQERFTDPLADVTDPAHRRRIDGRSPAGLRDRVVGRVRLLASGAEGALDRVSQGARDALGTSITVSFGSPPVELCTQLASADPVASVTRAGVLGFLHVDPGEHRLTVNGPGIAPLAVGFVHDGGLHRAGSAGDLTVVATEDAGWIRGDGRTTTGIAHVRIVEDYAGVVYEGAPVEADRFAVAVHRDGRYTVEVVDGAGRPGAYRVTPADFGDDGEAIREAVETGKASLAETLRAELADLLDLASEFARQDRGGDEVVERLSAALEAVDAATATAERGDAQSANDRLTRAAAALEEALDVLFSEDLGGYDDSSVVALYPRVQEAIDRAEVAVRTDLA